MKNINWAHLIFEVLLLGCVIVLFYQVHSIHNRIASSTAAILKNKPAAKIETKTPNDFAARLDFVESRLAKLLARKHFKKGEFEERGPLKEKQGTRYPDPAKEENDDIDKKEKRSEMLQKRLKTALARLDQFIEREGLSPETKDSLIAAIKDRNKKLAQTVIDKDNAPREEIAKARREAEKEFREKMKGLLTEDQLKKFRVFRLKHRILFNVSKRHADVTFQ